MFLTVTTNENGVAAVNVDQITHIAIAAFAGNGCKIYLASKEALSVRDTMDEVLRQINGEVPA